MPALQGVGRGFSVSWRELASEAPGLAEFGVLRLAAPPAYLATVDGSGAPRSTL